MDFDNSYFADEIRENFYIPGMVKRSWAMQMEILEMIAGICRKHDIKWFADCGTLLGAVRHGGFVPWDDDLDICMLRPDYEKFNSIVRDEIPGEFKVLNLEFEPEYDDFLTRITDNTVVDSNSEYLLSHHGFPYIAGIDIFPYDFLYDDDDIEHERKSRAKKMWDEAELIEDKAQRPYREINEIFKECKGPAKRVTLMPVYIKHNNDRRAIPVKYFDNIIKIPFENTVINAPAAYADVLKHEYRNWYVVKKDGGLHNYPFYSNQEKHLLEHTGNAPYVYIFEQPNDDYKIKRQLHAFNSQNAGFANNKIIFMPADREDFHGMKALYEELTADPNADAYIMPIPYAYRDDNGNPTGWIEWADDFGGNVRVLKYSEYDFAHEHAYAFVISNPLDEYESGRTVHPFFYSSNLKTYADNLIYCHSISIDEVDREDKKSFASMRYFVISPGVINADLICLPNENIKYAYMRIWMENLGKNETEKLAYKICIVENPDVNAGCGDEVKTGRKKLIFYAAFSDYYTKKNDAINWLRDTTRIFSENTDKLEIIWAEDITDNDNMKQLCPEIYEEYLKIRNDFSDNIGTIVTIDTAAEEIASADAFYGAPGYVMHQCANRKLPVMIRREL